jgi:hypothetical protein|tara:strand:+ start:149 stop:499 length:351 start_codon:yes stop_codon:yes gene_type:complete
MGMNRRFGKDKTWTGNDHGVLKLLFADTFVDTLSVDDMSSLAEKYTGKKRFEGRLKEHTVQRWTTSKNIPFEDMMVDWVELGLLSGDVADQSCKIKYYEDSLAVDDFIKRIENPAI